VAVQDPVAHEVRARQERGGAPAAAAAGTRRPPLPGAAARKQCCLGRAGAVGAAVRRVRGRRSPV
jgi:hypothetical protein